MTQHTDNPRLPVTVVENVSAHYPLSPAGIDPFVVQIIQTLQTAGYQAYVVGGGVRDKLLSCEPKDFDVVTNARPEQVLDLFHNCRLIGQRFRLAHVYERGHVVEVATFRASHELALDESEGSTHEGRIVRDNVYGNIEDDAFRRDFTLNALYYDPITDELLDWVGGLKDIENQTLQTIGDPALRLQEDPVRILRAIRISNKLGFGLESELENEIPRFVSHLSLIPRGRLFDEYTKLFLAGNAEMNFASLQQYQILEQIFPLLVPYLSQAPIEALVQSTLINTDRRIELKLGVNPAFLLAVFLWPAMRDNLKNSLQGQTLSLGSLESKEAEAAESAQSEPNIKTLQKTGNELHDMISLTLLQQSAYMAIPKRFTLAIRQVWVLQFWLEHRDARKIGLILSHFRFRAAYDFLLLRAEAQDADPALATWWTECYQADLATREKMISELPRVREPFRKKRRRFHPKRTSQHDKSPPV